MIKVVTNVKQFILYYLITNLYQLEKLTAKVLSNNHLKQRFKAGGLKYNLSSLRKQKAEKSKKVNRLQ